MKDTQWAECENWSTCQIGPLFAQLRRATKDDDWNWAIGEYLLNLESGVIALHITRSPDAKALAGLEREEGKRIAVEAAEAMLAEREQSCKP